MKLREQLSFLLALTTVAGVLLINTHDLTHLYQRGATGLEQATERSEHFTPTGSLESSESLRSNGRRGFFPEDNCALFHHIRIKFAHTGHAHDERIPPRRIGAPRETPVSRVARAIRGGVSPRAPPFFS